MARNETADDAAYSDPDQNPDEEWEDVGTGLGTQWDFNSSGPLIGSFIGSTVKETDDPQNPGQKRDTTAYLFDVDGRKYFVWDSYSLNEAFAEADSTANGPAIQIGTRLRISYEGKVDIGGGRSMKQYRVQRSRS